MIAAARAESGLHACAQPVVKCGGKLANPMALNRSDG